ncbi:MAG: S46 family peptidase, partial [Acidobacteria bacterium]|nr:S46 family peptidase [Acidobacteriota bacterium]
MRTVCLLFFLATSLLRADEGMWMPQQMPELEQHLKALGLQIPAKDLANPLSFPLNAVVSLGGCSASFVSENGLVITNHHCAYGAIQYNSSPENNLIANGFLAGSLEEELPAGPTSRIYVTTEIKDVTQDILNGLESLEPLARTQAIEDRIKKLEGEIDKIEGYRGVVQSFYEGASFFLVTQMEIRDVRLVYAPSDKVGEYGGDIDN